jgi:hypothetical protein
MFFGDFMNLLEGKKFILIGIVIVLLVAIPLTIFYLGQSQETRSKAQAATKLYFSLPEQMTQQSSPITKKSGDTFTVDVVVDPGTNWVTFAKLAISFDTTKLATAGGGIEPITTGTQGLPLIVEGPTYENGTILISLSSGADLTKVIQQPTKVAKLTFKALSPTGSTPTQIKFLDGQTKILSNRCDPANPQECQDADNENVLSSTTPVSIEITEGETTITPTTPATTPGPTTANAAPTCTSLVVDRTTSGPAPFSVTFTANGRDTDGTISKVTFNFGDGPVQDVTQSGGIGTNTVSVPVAHTYNNPGTFQASAIITDSKGSISSNTCSQTITVTAKATVPGAPGGTGGNGTGSGSGTTAPAPTIPPVAATTAPIKVTPTLASPGAGDGILRIGLIGTILSIVGALTFFAL